ncbi:dienelactone hydrolase [Coprinopsis cinerea AmutBmut pab1-1]|nr:dienelactone hydrolase [Coprinopsis cinerea AmutBmut pab1-1]
MSCPSCIEGEILPGEPVGSIQADFNGAYLSPGPPSKTGRGRAVIVCTDVFGLAIPNPKLVADRLASRLECDVWIPDYFAGQPIFPPSYMDTIPERPRHLSTWEYIVFIIKAIPNLPGLIRNRPAVVDGRLASFFSLLKEKKNYDKIGAVGYCFGGSACIRLGATDFVQSIIVCHPGPYTFAEVRKVQVPSAWVCAEIDYTVPDHKRIATEAEYAKRKGTDQFVDYEFKVYKGTSHGFACRPDTKYPEIAEAFEQAIDQKVAWFEKTLPVS